MKTEEQWLNEKILEFEKNPVETLTDMLIIATDVMERSIKNPTTHVTKALLEICAENNKQFCKFLKNKSSMNQQATFTSEDIRNKLSPIKNLIAMFEGGLVKVNIDTHDLILKEIEQCKKSIDYLSDK